MAEMVICDVRENCRKNWVLTIVLAGLVFAGCDGGCSACGEPTELPDTNQESGDELSWEQVSQRYAEHLPSNTLVAGIARGFSDLASALNELKPRLSPIFDLTILEVEIRNTFGFDISREVTFRENGIIYDHGFVLALLPNQPVLGFSLSDRDAFIARAEEVLRRQPFNLRAPVERLEHEGANIIKFFRRRNQPVEFVVVVKDDIGFLLPRLNSSVDLDALAEELAGVEATSSLGSNPEFVRQLSRFEGFPGFLFINLPTAVGFYGERLEDQLSVGQQFALGQLTTVLSIGGGLRLDDDAIVFKGYATVDPEVAEESRNIDEPLTSAPPTFERFALDTTFFGFRVSVNPATAWHTILRFQGETGARNLRERIQPFEEQFGASVEDQLTQVLSGNGIVMLNRIAPLTLMRAESIADYCDGLGLIAVFQIADRAQLLAVLDGAVGPEGLIREDDADGIVFRSRNSEQRFGNLIVREDVVILAPDRMRRRLSNNPPATHTYDLVRADSANGFFLRFAQLQNIGTVLNWPQPVQELLTMLDTISASARVVGDGILVTGRLEFAEE